MDNREIVKSALGMGLVTFISRIFGLMREWLRGYLLGTSGSSDAFAMAFMFPNLLRRLVGEGAMTAAFVPVFSDYLVKEETEAREEFVSTFFTAVLCFGVFIVVLVIFIAPVLKFFLPQFTRVPGKIDLTVLLTRLMFPYILFISLAALNQSILNTYRVFVPSAATPILLNISIIVIGLSLGFRLKDPGIALGIGVIIGGILQFTFQLPFLWKRDIKYRFSFHFGNPGVKKVVLLMLPGTIGAGVYQINTLVSQFIAASLEEGSVAALRFSNVLVEVVLGIFIISISTVILPALSEKASRGDREGMKEGLSYALRLVYLITVPAAIGLVVLRLPIIRMLFQYGRFGERSTYMVAYALLFHAPGIVGTGSTRIIVQMFFSMKDTRTPVYVAAVVMTVNLILCFLLSVSLRLGGIALAGSISTFVNFFLLFIVLSGRIGGIIDRRVIASLLKSLSASVIMGAALYLLNGSLGRIMNQSRGHNAAITLLLLCTGVTIFLVLSLVFRNKEVLELGKMFLQKTGFQKNGSK
jgi:putative peptidoglycan lipid II flippase